VCISLSPGIRINNAAILTLTQVKTLNLIRQWIRSLPDVQKNAVLQAFESASLPKIRRALRLLDELDREQRGPKLDIEILSTYNLEPVLPVLQLAMSCLPSQACPRLAPLDKIEAHIAQPAGSHPPAVFDARMIIWRVEEVLPEALYPFSCGFPEQVVARVDQLVERVDRLVSLHRRCSPGVPLFISTLAIPVHAGNTVLGAQHSAGLFASIARVNRHIYEVATRADGVYVLDVASWAALTGKSYADITVDFLARQPLSAQGQVGFAFFIARNLRPLIVPRRKVLALDLDNTLWGGVIGEDGLEGVILGHDFPGNVYLRMQRELLELRHQGVLLVIVSKNNEADARQAFECLPDMILKWDDFVVRKINWNPKHENLRAAATELGLGLDSFVFLDDSDYEREQMRQLLPEVLILNDNSDALHTLRTLWATDAFDSLVVSEEDRLRQHDYAKREARDVSKYGDDLEAFLKSLEMEATIEEIGPSNLERVVSMLSKTNQFNLTTRRHSRPEVQSILDRSGSIALALRLRDKFGDQGIVALSIAAPGTEDGALVVDSLLVSCRALGRGVEDALWSAMLNRALAGGARKLHAEFFATAKNGLATKFYDKVGLRCVERDSSAASYQLEPIIPYPSPSWIAVRNKTDEQ
jgi:FkbH-like protein